MQSESIAALAKALSAAQPELKAPKKEKTAKVSTKDGGSYSYSYADLGDVIECYRGPLARHGLSVVQPMRVQDGHIVLVTKLIHDSGEWIASEYPVAPFQRPQEQGSAITYARRYAVSALLGIAAEDDDDGKAAQDAAPRKAKAKEASPAPAPPPAKGELSQAEVLSIHDAAKRAGLRSTGQLAPVLMAVVGVSKATEVSKADLGKVLDALEALEPKAVPA